jgi:hypothetical protein
MNDRTTWIENVVNAKTRNVLSFFLTRLQFRAKLTIGVERLEDLYQFRGSPAERVSRQHNQKHH